jgi:molybdate transport system substrate-binding protein
MKPTTRPQHALLAFAALLLLLLNACAPHADDPAHPHDLTLFAAASLAAPFEDLAQLWQTLHPGARVTLNHAGSQTLRLQIEHGARPDLFASANPEHLRALQDQGLTREPTPFAQNRLVLITPKNNPAHLLTLQDLPKAQHIALGTPEVPVGAYTRRLLQSANQHIAPDFQERVLQNAASQEPDVRLIVTRVRLGAADAGIVYATDAHAAQRDLHIIPLPEHLAPTADYPIAPLTHAPNPQAAQAWIDLLRSPDGQRILQQHGFLPPPPPHSTP